MTSSSPRADARDGSGTPSVGLAWALKRALIGMLIFLVVIGGAAWLLYATIEPESADATGVYDPVAASARIVAADTH